ncbi:hypothetical protein E2986_08054 [Frieseomelitta varia]|uniref:Tetratricopeptide repeat protein 37 n=1 Tax=Frieseomelitta varia TaxID=561572 RepID=A0A833WAY6_9HYME|nr:tetratricopeptide repeat protein 37 [Frieseomelitta varia]XP_043507966.1 tetratricopeptide repeat protein 37 [Frieseomelitta varia]KAF3430707.1 hypothetical protein E2986_08054 [Frieseomelitta varia]
MSNEIKLALKEARETFKENNYIDVIKKCKKILKKDQNNYAALMLLAAAMKEIDEYKSQVPLVLQRGIQIQADNPLAWHGLVAYYEKNLDNNDCYNQLLLAYCKLLQIESDSKFTYISNKLLEFSFQLKDIETINQCIEHLSELRKNLDDNRVKMIDKALGCLLLDNFYNLDKYQNLLKCIFKSVINDLDATKQRNFYKKYLKILYDKDELNNLINEAVNMHQQFPEDVLPLEYICRVYCEQNILNKDFTDVDITKFYECLLKLNEESETAKIVKALHLIKSNNLTTAREILKDILTLKPSSIYGWMALSEISRRLHCWEDAEVAAKRVLDINECKIKDKLLYKMELTLVEAMSRTNDKNKWETAFQMCKDIRPSTQLDLIRARLNILLNQSDVHILLDNLELNLEIKTHASILRALYLKQNKQYEEAVNILDSVLEAQSSEAWLLLGIIYWEMAEYNYSLMAFLNGIKADRFNWKCLIYLGHYYREHGNDMERSRKCYQTALQINPNSEEAGIGLSTAYRLLKNQDANIKLLQMLTVQGSGPRWAWLQLGLQYLDQGNAEQAIKAFQHVIRADSSDSHCWESLADAYFIRGAYTSALKSYQRALELCPKSLYPMIQLANIKLIIGQYKEAKKDFECILINESCYIPALKGLAEACLALAKNCTAKQLLGRANDYLQQAMDNLTIAIKECKDTSCLWKLLGDVCYRVATLPEKYSHLKISSILFKHESVENIILLKRLDIFTLSIRCYCCAISLSPKSASLWHDLVLCYLMQLQHDPSVNHKNLASKCLAAAKYAVKLCPSTWIHWNLLGVICMSPYIRNYALAQHAYIMAIDKELNNAIVWCNLGTLYLYIGNFYKANEAYSRAQRADPAYINSWIGQASIAEMMQRKETMDLFRHAIQLGYHNQAAVGYAHWILDAILNSSTRKNTLYFESVSITYSATNVMTLYVENRPNDCYARNAYGLLLERQKLYKSAAEQFAVAVCNSTKNEKDLVSINLARVLIRLKKYNEAIKLCRTVTNVNYNSQCHLALALFKAAQYEEAYVTYETTLHSFADTEIEKSYTLCAMAAIAYTFQRVDDAKTLLFQCMQLQRPVITSLLAAASLGILHGDINLTTLVLNELKLYETHPKYGHHILNLFVYFYLIGNDIKKAITILSKAIFKYPGNVKYWTQLLRILLETDLQLFSRCAQKVLFLNRNIITENHAHVACALSFSCFIQNTGPTSIRSMQKLLFTYPANIESWAMFIAAFLSRSTIKNCKVDIEWLSAFITIVQQNYQSTSLMTKWLKDSKIKLRQLN